MGTQGYKSNNLSDEVKHSNLENLARLLIEGNPRYVHYFELHSGAGRYRENGRRELRDGSAIRVLNMLRSEILVHEAFLHEKDPKLRAKLKRNIRPYIQNNNISVFGDWKDEIEEHLTLTNYESIYVLDPTHLSAYDEEDGLLVWLGPIIENSSAVFMYAPQNINPSFPKKKRHARTINMIHRIIKSRKRRGMDLMHFAGNGYHQRIDHNIVVADPVLLQKLKEPHRAKCEELGVLRKGYPTFRYIR